MKNKLFIKSKFENCIYFVFAVFLFVVGLYFGITNKNIEGFSLIIPEVFGWPLFALSILFMGFEVYYLVTKNESLYKIYFIDKNKYNDLYLKRKESENSFNFDFNINKNSAFFFFPFQKPRAHTNL